MFGAAVTVKENKISSRKITEGRTCTIIVRFKLRGAWPDTSRSQKTRLHFHFYSVHHNICMRLRLEKSACYCSTNKFHCAQQHSNQSWHYWQPATTKRCGLCLQQPRQSNIETPFEKLIFSRKRYKKKTQRRQAKNERIFCWLMIVLQETKRYGIKRSCSRCVKMKANTRSEANLTSCQLLVDNHHILDTLCSVKKTAKSHTVKICLNVLHLL